MATARPAGPRFRAAGLPNLKDKLPTVLSCRAEARVWLQSSTRVRPNFMRKLRIALALGLLLLRGRLLAARLSDAAAGRRSDCGLRCLQDHSAILAAHWRRFPTKTMFLPSIWCCSATAGLPARHPLHSRRCASAVLGGCADPDWSGDLSRFDLRRLSGFAALQRARGAETADGNQRDQPKRAAPPKSTFCGSGFR